jgi:hypothetical protein
MRMNPGGTVVIDTVTRRGIVEIIDQDQAGIIETGIGIDMDRRKETEIEKQGEIKREITIVSEKKEILQDAMVTLVISVHTETIHMIVMPLRREDHLSIERKESAFPPRFKLGKHTIEYHG